MMFTTVNIKIDLHVIEFVKGISNITGPVSRNCFYIKMIYKL